MNLDLERALSAVADRATAAASPVPVDRLVMRLHRKRIAQTATYSAIGVGAAAAVTIGAIAANGALTDRDPVPPATGAPTSTPTQTSQANPTPTTSPTATEVAWAPNWDLCGMPAEDFQGQDTNGPGEAPSGWQVFVDGDFETAYPVDEPVGIAVSAGLWGMPEQAVEARVTDVVALGTDEEFQSTYVVGIAAGPTAAVTRGTVSEDQPLPVEPFTTSIVSCAASPLAGGDGALDTRLEEGAYYLEAVVDLATENGTITAVTWLGYLGQMPAWDVPEEWVPGPPPNLDPVTVAVGGSLRLGSDRVWNNTNKSLDSQAFTCGQPAEHSSFVSEPPEIGTVTATAFLDGQNLVVRWTVTNDGAPHNHDLMWPYVAVSRDGVLVGQSWFDSWIKPEGPEPWGTGESVTVEMEVGPRPCVFIGEEAWPPGTYEVYVDMFAPNWIPEPTEPGQQYSPPTLRGGPFTFTLD